MLVSAESCYQSSMKQHVNKRLVEDFDFTKKKVECYGQRSTSRLEKRKRLPVSISRLSRTRVAGIKGMTTMIASRVVEYQGRYK